MVDYLSTVQKEFTAVVRLTYVHFMIQDCLYQICIDVCILRCSSACDHEPCPYTALTWEQLHTDISRVTNVFLSSRSSLDPLLQLERLVTKLDQVVIRICHQPQYSQLLCTPTSLYRYSYRVTHKQVHDP